MDEQLKNETSLRITALLDAHWEYIYGLLRAHGEGEEYVDIARFHYWEAFRHGYKHAIEDFLAGLYPSAYKPMVPGAVVVVDRKKGGIIP